MLTDAQIEARKDAIGGSDAAVVCGMSKRMTARELFHLKRGEIDEDANPNDELAWLGNEIEPIIARAYTKETNRNVARCNVTLVHPDLPWMIAHIDRRVRVRKPRRGLELKYRVHADEWGPAGSDAVPEDVLIQCEHYLAVTGYDVWDVEAFLGGREFRGYEIPRDQTLIDRLINRETEFIDRLRNGDPPPLDHEHPTARQLLQKLYPGTDGRAVALGDECQHWHEVRLQAQEMIKRYSKVFDAATAHIEDVMGTASIGLLPSGDGYNRKRIGRRAYQVEKSAYIQTRFMSGAKEITE